MIKLLLITLVAAASSARYHDTFHDHYNSYYKQKEIKTIPQVGSDNALVNIGGLVQQGIFFYSNLIKQTQQTVFKIKLEEERVIIADPIAIHNIYDVRKVYKDTGAGLANFNLVLLRGYHPSLTTNGRFHAEQKSFQLRYLLQRYREYPMEEMFKRMKFEINQYAPITEPNSTDVDFDKVLETISTNTITHFLTGEAFNDYDLHNEWFSKLPELKASINPNPDTTDEDEIEVADRVLKKFKATPVFKELHKIKTKLNQTQVEQLYIFFSLFAATAGARHVMASTVPNFHRLSGSDRNLIMNEAKTFFENDRDSFKKRFSKLHTISKFALETMRFLNPVTEIFARARHDFVVKSLSGYYQIKKDQLINAQVYDTQRNKDSLRAPDEFRLDGDDYNTKINFFAFGGPYYQRVKVRNHKCLGQHFTLNLLKMFVLHLTKCTIEPGNDWSFTASNGTRRRTTDNPMKIKTFKCDN